jgi:hypothetical protein
MPDPIAAARHLIQSRLADLDAEAKQLERALANLGEGSRPQRHRPGRPRKRVAAATSAPPKPKRRVPRKRKSAKRAPRAAPRRDQRESRRPPRRPRQSDRRQTHQVHALITKARAEKLIVKRGNGYALRA